MASASATGSIQVVVVTPEKAVLDATAEFVVLPLFDGEAGVAPGHAPFVGQLGPGEFRFRRAGTTERYFVDGGFAQVRSNTVTVLTPRAVPVAQITAAQTAELRTAAEALPTTTAAERTTRERSIARATAMARLAERAPA